MKRIGFTDVVFRAGLQGCARPSNWVQDNKIACPVAYSQETENDNFAVIASAHDVLDRVFAKTTVRRWYDLAVEGSGWPKPHPEYNARLWKRYTERYGNGDTYGFSIAFQPGRLTESYKAYDAAGVRPAMIAVDMYDRFEGGPSMEIMFAKLAKEMRGLGLSDTPVVVQETYYNHKPSYHAIVAASERYGMDIYAIYQWSMDTANLWHDTPVRFEAYCPALIEKVASVEQTASAK